MLNVADTFGGPLRADPALGLAEPIIPHLKSGPLPKVQFVIEMAGPRTVLTSSASALLRPDWQKVLGQPQVWAMSPGDSAWHLLGSTSNLSLDSLALAWDMFGENGQLSAQSAGHLHEQAEKFAAQIGRRAMPMPMPDQVERLITHWGIVKENLDVGFSIAAVAEAPMPERDIWRLCAAIGLQFGPKGSFDWIVEGWPGAMLSVTPLEADAFSLAAVQEETAHTGVTIGFNVPRNPAPEAAFDALFMVAAQFERKLACKLYNESLEPLPTGSAEALKENLRQAIQLIEKAGLKPGCAEALKLFPI